MRNMSFALTTRRFLDGTKTVTRRVEHRSKRNGKLTGWANLKPGEYFTAVEKSQGMKKGEKVVVLGQCRCVTNNSEPLNHIIKAPHRPCEPFGDLSLRPDVAKEGFPDLTPEEFVEFFCAEMRCTPLDRVRRIEFVRV